MSFDKEYLKIKQLALSELEIIENNLINSVNIREPLNSYIKNFLSLPSKRVRSLLGILCLKAQGFEISQNQVEILTVVELIHNASLIHDDIIDESEYRRSQKTVANKFGNKLGVISGDYLLSVAMEKIANLKNPQILDEFSKTIKQMCIGEINQNFDRFKIGIIEDYIDKSKNKTGYLFESAVVCPQILLNNVFIRDFGLNVGIAFQIRDDLLNLTNTDISKPANNDISEGIYNAPVIYAKSADNYSSGIEKTKALLNNYIDKSRAIIADLPDNEYKIGLDKFLELLGDE